MFVTSSGMTKSFNRIKYDCNASNSDESYELMLEVWTFQLNTSIEYFDAFDTEQPTKLLWSGSIYLTVHREIDFGEAVKLGYKKLSKFYMQKVSKKGSFHILDL